MTALPERAAAAALRRAQHDPRWQQAMELLEYLDHLPGDVADEPANVAAGLIASWERFAAESAAAAYVGGQQLPPTRELVATFLQEVVAHDGDADA